MQINEKQYNIENINNDEQNMKINVNNSLKKTTLSVISSILTIMQIIILLFQFNKSEINFFGLFPFLLVSLVLAIISKCTYNDKLSIIVIIVDCILLGLTIIAIILYILIFITILDMIFKGCSGNL